MNQTGLNSGLQLLSQETGFNGSINQLLLALITIQIKNKEHRGKKLRKGRDNSEHQLQDAFRSKSRNSTVLYTYRSVIEAIRNTS